MDFGPACVRTFGPKLTNIHLRLRARVQGMARPIVTSVIFATTLASAFRFIVRR